MLFRSDTDLFYSDLEIDIFRELNRPPTIENIPKLYLAIRSMPNPFAIQNNASYMVDELGMSQMDTDSLLMKRRVSVMAMDMVTASHQPADLPEVKLFIKSLLETIRFTHSRNIMHCDLHRWNYFWDGVKGKV